MARGDAPAATDWTTIDGSGQRIGLVESTASIARTSPTISRGSAFRPRCSDHVSEVHVAGGATPGPDAAEVLIDIDSCCRSRRARMSSSTTRRSMARAPSKAMFNRMVNDGMTLISNSWSYCEDQTTLADVDGHRRGARERRGVRCRRVQRGGRQRLDVSRRQGEHGGGSRVFAACDCRRRRILRAGSVASLWHGDLVGCVGRFTARWSGWIRHERLFPRGPFIRMVSLQAPRARCPTS